MDDARLLGHGDEAVGRHQALAWVVPPDERFHRVDRARGKRDLRLVVEDELALRNRAPQLSRQARAAQRLRRLLRLIGGVAAARALRDVHRAVRTPEQRAWIVAL